MIETRAAVPRRAAAARQMAEVTMAEFEQVRAGQPGAELVIGRHDIGGARCPSPTACDHERNRRAGEVARLRLGGEDPPSAGIGARTRASLGASAPVGDGHVVVQPEDTLTDAVHETDEGRVAVVVDEHLDRARARAGQHRGGVTRPVLQLHDRRPDGRPTFLAHPGRPAQHQ